MDSIFDCGGNFVDRLRTASYVINLVEELVCLSSVHKNVELSEGAIGGLAHVLLVAWNGLGEAADHFEADHYEKVVSKRAGSLSEQMLGGRESDHKGQRTGNGKIQEEDVTQPPEGQCQIPCRSFQICQELLDEKKRKKTA